MGTRINTNTLAMNAARYGQMNDAKVASSIEKLSSGLRINRAADDAAGLVISESLRAQVSGLDQAIRNSNEAANMVKTAEGALGEVHDLLRNIRTLANHAANAGANETNSLAADQAQITNALKSLDRISANTSFGNLKLLDGTASTKVESNTGILKGASATGSTARGTYSVEVTDAGTKGKVTASAALNYGKVAVTTGTATLASALAAGSTLTITDAAAGVDLGISDTVIVDLQGASTVAQVAEKINSDETAKKYVQAEVDSSGRLVLNSRAATTAAGAAEFTATFSSSGLAASLGLGSGGTAAFTGTATAATADKLIMDDITYSVVGNNRDGTVTSAKTFSIAKGTALSEVFSQFDAFAKANGIESSMSMNSAGLVKVENNDVGDNRGINQLTTAAPADDLLLLDAEAEQGGTDMTLNVNGHAVAASDIDGSKVNITSASGVNLKAAVGMSFGVSGAVTNNTGSLTVGGGSLKFQIGANAGEQTEVQIESVGTETIGKGVAAGKSLKDIDVSTVEGATEALQIIDKAIMDVSNARAKLGAFQSQVLESNVRSLGVAKENLMASESTIRDTDMAAEMVNFTKNNILSQASQAMLSQANNSSQGILQLLRG